MPPLKKRLHIMLQLRYQVLNSTLCGSIYMKKFSLSLAAASLLASTTVAAAVPPAVERAAAPIEEAEEAGNKIPLALIILLFGAGAAAIIALIESNDGEVIDRPASP